MNNLFEYIRQLQSQLNIFSSEGKKGLDTLQVSAKSLSLRFSELSMQKGFVDSSDIVRLREYSLEVQSLDVEFKKLEKSNEELSNSVKKNKFPDSLKQIIESTPFASLLNSPLTQAIDISSKSIKLGMQKELDKTEFEIALGSGKSAEKLMNDLSGIKMDQSSLIDGAKNLLKFNLESEKVAPLLSAMGDISIGNSSKMESLVSVFNRISSAGQLTQEDLTEMINLGFNPLEEISRTTGEGVDSLKDKMNQGSISAAMVGNSLISVTDKGGKFYNGLEKQSQTLQGKWDTAMQSANNSLLTLYSLISPILDIVVELTGKFLDFISSGLEKMFNLLQDGDPLMWGIVTVLGAYVIGMGLAELITNIASGALWKQITAWWSLNSAMLANPVGLIIAGVIALIAIIGFLIYKIDGWGQVWEALVERAKYLWDFFTESAKFQFDRFVGKVLNGIDRVTIAWHRMDNLFGGNNDSEIIKLEASIKKRNTEISLAENALDKKSAASDEGKKLRDSIGNLSWNKDKTIPGFINETMSKLGLNKKPNQSEKNGAISFTENKPKINKGIETSLGSKNSNTEKVNEATTTGGSKSNYITINLESLVNALTINTQNSSDSADQLQSQTTDALLRTLAMATTAG